MNKYHRDEKESGVVPTAAIKVSTKSVKQKAFTEGFVCEFCQEALPSLDKLNEHMVMKHWDQQENSGILENEEAEPDEGNAEDKEKDRHPEDKLICPVCHVKKKMDLDFPTVKDYEDHIRWHYRGNTVSDK